MASQWLLDEVNNSLNVTPTVTTNPVVNTVQKPATQPSMVDKINNLNQKVGESPLMAPQRMATAGLGWVGQQLSRPLYAFGGFLKGARQESEKQVSQGHGVISGFGPAVQTGAREAVKGFKLENQVSPGDYLTNDVLKMKEGAGKIATGFATDIVTDPLNFLAFNEVRKPLSAVAGKVGKVGETMSKTKPVQKAVEFARKTPALYKPIEATVNPYFRNPEAGKIIETTKEAIRGRVAQLYHQVDEAQKGLTSAEKVRVGQILEGGITTGATDQKLVNIANQFSNLAEDVGQEAVKTGLLDPESFAKYRGKYMSHIWVDAVGGNAGGKVAEIPKISGQFFKHRKGAEGYVKEFQAPVFKGLGTEIKDVEAAKMYQNLGKTFGKTPATAQEMGDLANKGYKYAEDIAKSRGGQVLNKTVLPQEIIDYVNRTRSSAKTELGKIFDAGMNLWKQGKTVWNPAYHVRNVISNQILSELQTGRGIPATLFDYVKSVKRYLGGGNQQYVNEARDLGMIKTKYFGQAVEDLLGEGFKKKNLWQKITSTPHEFQTFMEETAKLNVFTEMRRQGKTAQEAMKLAEEALFSPYRIPAAERSVLGRAIPFYSFTRQATPFVAKKLATHPERFTKYIKAERAVEKLSQPNQEQNLPDYMKEMVRTPFKNREGQQYYFNPQYIYPWGNFVQESKGLPLGLNMNPLIEEYAAQKTGVDPYFGSEFVRESMPKSEQVKARLGHAATTFLPSAYRSIQGKIIPALQGRPDYQGRERNLPVTLAGEVAGLKMYPYDTAGAAKNKSTQKYIIQKDYQNEVKGIMKNKSLTTQEKRKKIQDLQLRMQERLNGLD